MLPVRSEITRIPTSIPGKVVVTQLLGVQGKQADGGRRIWSEL